MALHFDDSASKTDASNSAANNGTAPKLGGKLNAPSPKRAAIIAGAAVALVVAVYFAGKLYFTSHFVPGTKVGGLDASWLTTEQLAEKAEEARASYTDHVSGDGIDLTLSADDLGLTIDGTAWAEDARSQIDPANWFSDAFAHQSITPSTGSSVDDAKVLENVSAAVAPFNETATDPTDAILTYNEETNTFDVTPDVLGTKVSADTIAASVSEDAKNLVTETTLGNKELLRAGLSTDSEAFNAAVQKANDILALSYTLTLDGKELPIDPVDGKITHNWISVVNGDNGPEVKIDEHNSWQWCFDNLNAVVNGENETRVWEVESTQNGMTEVATVTMETRPEESEGAHERGRHIDINLSTQYARLYDENGNVLWRSYIVSGDVGWGNNTPTGEFEITKMSQQEMMTGLNNGWTAEEAAEDPENGYYHSLANYWMAFIGDSVALHDATWRWDSEFGGETYLWNGSHGCVNLPYDKAEELYGLTEVGDVVITHY